MYKSVGCSFNLIQALTQNKLLSEILWNLPPPHVFICENDQTGGQVAWEPHQEEGEVDGSERHQGGRVQVGLTKRVQDERGNASSLGGETFVLGLCILRLGTA